MENLNVINTRNLFEMKQFTRNAKKEKALFDQLLNEWSTTGSIVAAFNACYAFERCTASIESFCMILKTLDPMTPKGALVEKLSNEIYKIGSNVKFLNAYDHLCDELDEIHAEFLKLKETPKHPLVNWLLKSVRHIKQCFSKTPSEAVAV